MLRTTLSVSTLTLLLAAAPAAHASRGNAPAAPASGATAAQAAPASGEALGGESEQVKEYLKNIRNSSTWGHPDLFGEYAGMSRYAKGDYKGAMKYFKIGARYADKLSQLAIGLMYGAGLGVEKDPVKSCAWLALSAQRNFPKFVATRDAQCSKLTAAQRAEAVDEVEKLLPEYGDKVAMARMARELRHARTEMTGSRVGFDMGVTSAIGGADGNINANSGPTVVDFGKKFWAPWRWDPDKYFAARNAMWTGTVTVGDVESTDKPTLGPDQHQPAGSAQPAPASSQGH